MPKKNYPMLDLFEQTPDLVCIVDKPGWLKKINPAVERVLGYSSEELFARPVSALIHPDDREMTSKRRNDLLMGKPLLNFQNRYISKYGAIVWLEWTSVYIAEEEVVFAIAKDITTRKMVEIEIEDNYKKYKELVTHFKHHVEKDRASFAVELHEELAQLATVIKMHFESADSLYKGADTGVTRAIKHGLTASELLINKMRKLSYSMNSTRIEELGLDTVLRSLCEEFAAQTKIPCIYQSFFIEDDLDDEIKLDLFRICQEALLNVMHHAQATEVVIHLEETDDKIELSVTDNGKGFAHKSSQRFGLKNMRGRALSINGEFLIESRKSKGTTVRVRVNTKR